MNSLKAKLLMWHPFLFGKAVLADSGDLFPHTMLSDLKSQHLDPVAVATMVLQRPRA